MSKVLPTTLQALIVLVTLGALAFLLGMPHLEGRNAQATTFEIYFNDAFLAYVYLGSIPFFIALHQAFKALGRFRRERAITPATVRALRAIKRCALALVILIVPGVIFIVSTESDDHAGGLFMAFLVAFGAAFVATAAAKYERVFRDAAGMKTEGKSST